MADFKNDNIETVVDWYIKNQTLYKALSKKVESILSELIEIEKVNYHVIVSREKDISSFSKKIKKKEYNNPIRDVTDLAGIRIITYVEDQIPQICKIIETNFDIDTENSSDKSYELGEDKVGYKSIHYVAKLKPNRITLPEYKRFENLYFEIQVRTILQHAWAEIEHDRNYKFSGVLPTAVRRRFKLLAGLLESADNEFNSISIEIDNISDKVRESTNKGELDIPINSTSLREYIITKFNKLVRDEFTSPARENYLLETLNRLRITTLKDLNDRIPVDFVKLHKAAFNNSTSSINNIVEDILIANDYQSFFENYWNSTLWARVSIDDVTFWRMYNIPVEELMEKYGLSVINEQLEESKVVPKPSTHA